MQRRITQKDGASQPTGPRQGCLTEAGSHVSSDQVLAELNRTKVLFQLRAVTAAMGIRPTLIQASEHSAAIADLQFFSPLEDQFGRQHFRHSIPAGRTQEGARVDTPSGSGANDFNRSHEDASA